MDVGTTDEPFHARVEPLRRELTVHCYRMMGSAHDAEDLVQETYLKAWRAFPEFENRSSLRTWMYRIATNTCLTALRKKERRTLPTGLGQPRHDPDAALDSRPELPWLEPLPDAMAWGTATDDPAETVVTRDSVRLAFVAALQHLTARQRAVLLLREVLGWSAREVATLLETSVAAVNSSLQRARAHLNQLDSAHYGNLPENDEHAHELTERFLAAFEAYDIAEIVDLLTEDAIWEMPPYTGWYQGASNIGRLIADQCPAERAGDMRIVRTGANAMPVLAVYLRDTHDAHRAFQLQQLTLTPTGVAHVACYFDTALFRAFDLPSEVDFTALDASHGSTGVGAAAPETNR